MLGDAVRAAAPAALDIARDQQHAAMDAICSRGIDPAEASAGDVASLQAAVAPVLAALRGDPQTRSALSRSRRCARRRSPSRP